MKELNISDIISDAGVFTDGDWVESKDQNPKGSVRLIQLADIGDGYFVNKSQRFMTKEAAIRLKCTFLNKGDILIARMPDPIGRACIFPDIGQDAVTVVDVCVVRPQKEDVFTPFIKYLINSPTFRYKISKHITGTTRKRISRRNLNKIGFVLPSITNQKRIAKVLWNCEQLIQWRKESIKLLDDYLESTFLEMFGDPTKFNTIKLSKLAENKKHALSSGPFGSSLTSKHYVDKGVLVLRGKNISSGKIDLSDIKFVSKPKAKELERSSIVPNDIVIVAVGSSGQAIKIPENFQEAIMSQNFNKISPNTDIVNPTYLEHSINSEIVQSQFRRVLTDAGRSFLSLTKIKEVEIPYPKKSFQDSFEVIANKIEQIKSELEASLSELENLFGSISQRAFKGELNLDKINIEESEVVVIENKQVLHGRNDFEDDSRLKKRIEPTNKKDIAKRDITNLTFLDFLGVPFELYKDKIADDYGPELDFIDDDLFYQFYLKDHFGNDLFTFSELQSKFNSYYIPKGKDFDPTKWKSIIFKYLEAKKPLIEQSFEEESGTIKLKLTDEAFKA